MAIPSVTSQPITVPGGIRMTAGTIAGNSATYSTGFPVTAAQFGGGSNGIPNRLPDFVVLGNTSKAIDGTDAFTNVAVWTGTNVRLYGAAATTGTDEKGIAEVDEAPGALTISFLAIWVEAAPQTVA